MKQLILTLILVTLSAPVCLGEWLEVSKGESGNTFYVDFERIKEHGGYVYFWELEDNLSPAHWFVSSTSYKQADCNLFRFRWSTVSYYREPMGEGTPVKIIDKPTLVPSLIPPLIPSLIPPQRDWHYPSDSGAEVVLKAVCDYVESK